MGNGNSKRNQRGKTVIRPMSKVAMDEIKKHYNIDSSSIGKGAFGKVFKAQSLTDKSFTVAIKMLSKSNMSAKDIKELGSEVHILNQLDHPNIVKYYEVYEDKKSLYLVMEYWSGSNLYEKLTDQNIKFSETEWAKMAKQLLLALHHCHSSGVTHRDIKLENIMVTDDNIVKLIDFGLSKNATAAELMKSMTGTPYYMAPEVFLSDSYGSEVDLWSLGVVLFTCLGGYRPFAGKDIKEISDNILSGKYKFHPREWSSISRDAKDLVQMMLTIEPDKRITSESALDHAWFGLITDIKLESTILLEGKVKSKTMKKLKNFRELTCLRRWALELLINMLSVDEKQAYETEFNKFDTTKNGVITDKDFIAKIKESDPSMQTKEIKKISKEIDFNDDDQINYSEFITAILDVNKWLTKERLTTIYKKFLQDKHKNIYPEDLRKTINTYGFTLTETEWEDIIREYDISKTGYLSIDDFKTMMVHG